ncbi:hypothetical protein JOF41_006444 [Saccharothrix coeruleofusca]|uniref:pentapeptide repeat-containing protein n=1 Tax=Saccharothrix coeruleofusca TaxID=33919 RepID=UPI001AE4C200|nr:pentapeptide repeat-containing protein [Saccharothrix coeruleofusca]MBP2340266.1 hypothetical protein [Saccharothrix coeruleofusca]
MTSDRGHETRRGRVLAEVRWGWVSGLSLTAGGVLGVVALRPWWSEISIRLGQWWPVAGTVVLFVLGVTAMHRRALAAQDNAGPARTSATGTGTTATGKAEVTERRSSLSGWVVLTAAISVLGVAVLVLAVMWDWSAVPGLGAKDAASTRLETVKFAASVAVAGGGFFALYLAARRQRTQELELAQRHAEFDHSERDATERRVTELYTKAVEQLGSDKAVVRQGGLYALERVAQDNPTHRQTVINVICAYLRSPYTPPPDRPITRRTGLLRSLRGTPAARVAAATASARRISLNPPTPSPTEEESRQEREVRLTAQRILAAHLRPNLDEDTGQAVNPRYWGEGYDLDLTGSTLIDFNMTGCHVNTASFRGATFTGNALFHDATFTRDALFDDATFTRNAWFHRATFTRNAEFNDATFTGDAEFHDATFTRHAWFHRATFTGDAEFNDATFTRNAWFHRATFTRNAEFNDATFTRDALFDNATFTRNAWFHRATFTRNAEFNDATFTGDAEFHDATFTGHAWFNDAAFQSIARADDVWVRIDQPRSNVRPLLGENSWPAGWTVDGSVAAPRDGRDGKWAQLVPVPIVLTSLPSQAVDA